MSPCSCLAAGASLSTCIESLDAEICKGVQDVETARKLLALLTKGGVYRKTTAAMAG
jgi:hypothetical protein